MPVTKVMADAKEPFDPKSYLPAIAGYYTDSKGNMLSFPFNSSTVVLYINRDAFKKAGLNPDQVPKTWKEMNAAALQLKVQGPGLRLHVRLAGLDAHRELQRLAQRADRHQGERHGAASTPCSRSTRRCTCGT